MKVKIGFEVHQQLDTNKLFCDCPAELREDAADIVVERGLRPTQSELGEIDRAALQEFLKGKRYVYQAYSDATCLVEMDEEPPHRPNDEAIEIALEVALLLSARPVDEVHFMRKLVIDGSNTSGFQRTAIVAMDGHLDTKAGAVKIPTICLEEEAARKMGEGDGKVIYRLDRLGIPLVEITTSPDIESPEQAKEIAYAIGQILRATGKVKRGLGTIRQDINVSIEGGARVEIKGVQELDQIPAIISGEIKRQEKLNEIAKELKRRRASPDERLVDVSRLFSGTQSKVVKKQMERGGVALAVKLKGYRGLLGYLELGRYAMASGLGGIIHSDELPAYGVTVEEVKVIEKELGIADEDAFALAVAQRDKAEIALKAVKARVEAALKGVPEETRMANTDGTTSYMRPLPGAARMYPETDIPPVPITAERIERIGDNLPELLDEKMSRFVEEHELSSELASQLAKSERWPLFEEVVAKTKAPPSVVANTLLGTMKELKRNGYNVDGISEEKIIELFFAVGEGRIGREAIPAVIKTLAKGIGKGVEEIASELGLVARREEEVVDHVRRILEERRDFVLQRGMDAEKPLMGPVMKELRGRADGKLISEILRRELKKFLERRG